MTEDWITVDTGVCHGKPVIRGTRIMVSNILSLLAGGYTVGQILDYYPELSQEAIKASLEYAIEVVGEEVGVSFSSPSTQPSHAGTSQKETCPG